MSNENFIKRLEKEHQREMRTKKQASLPRIQDVCPSDPALTELKERIVRLLELHKKRNALYEELEQSVVHQIVSKEPGADPRNFKGGARR